MFDGGGVIDEFTNVDKVGMGNGRFLLLYLMPFGDKFLWSHKAIINCQLLIVNYQLQFPHELRSVADADRAAHAEDQSAYTAVLPDVVVWPHDTAQVSACRTAMGEQSSPRGARAAALKAIPSLESSATAVFDIIASGLEPDALELLDETAISIINAETDLALHAAPNLFMEFSGGSAVALQETLPLVEEICQSHGCINYQAGVGREERARLWEARHAVFEAHLRHFPNQRYIVTDTAVPISNFPALVAAARELMVELGVTGGIVSHAGDGNVHTILFYPPDDVDLKGGVDPNDILNPGKVLG